MLGGTISPFARSDLSDLLIMRSMCSKPSSLGLLLCGKQHTKHRSVLESYVHRQIRSTRDHVSDETRRKIPDPRYHVVEEECVSLKEVIVSLSSGIFLLN
ncbi:uncharacterized protein CCOS01_16487 [Colletotrichum costaricense]|uniref:Uncharacterized protein n=1 Tax=Colletotrichum costaricense TaxID=1209916 RepID=A0AAJ0DS73_9PEZI|nr:uncharacterized protein CCOS01_16487 [Colletotrichum costaricense]KAK1506435.1 hypothetical protein CCOS01_16487 [Colletotrichum costaricense]